MSEEDNPQNHHVKKTREDCDVNGLKHDVSDKDVASKPSRSKPKKKGGELEEEPKNNGQQERETETGEYCEDIVQIKKEVETDDGSSKLSNKKDSDHDEIIFVGTKKASAVSLRKSLQLQEKQHNQRKLTNQLKEQRGKKLAAKFILNESSVTFCPPSGYYREFGVRDHKGLGGRSPEIIELFEEDDDETDDMIVDDLPKRKVMLKNLRQDLLKMRLSVTTTRTLTSIVM